MTALSSLVGGSGGGGHPYPSGVPLWGPMPDTLAVVTSAADNDDLLRAFVPRADLTVDKVCWWRGNTTAANVYVGVYDKSGNLLTDCAVDSDTTEGIHEVETTNVDLTAGELYYIAINQSANVAVGDIVSLNDEGVAPAFVQYAQDHQVDLGIFAGGTAPGSATNTMMPKKDRTTAALLDPMTMTGWGITARYLLTGVVPA